MSILEELKKKQSSEDLVLFEYDAARRAHYAARALNDIQGAVFWGQRANDIARQLAGMTGFDRPVTLQ